MKKLVLITLLILINIIYADGIIPNLKQYLTRYPNRIDEQGWVTIPRSDLLRNTQPFKPENCDYKLVHSDTSIAYPIKMTSHSFIFKAPSAEKDYLHLIEYNKKHKIIACWQSLSKRENSSLQVTAFKQLSPESIKYARNKYLNSILSGSYSFDDVVELIVKMEKKSNKSCCERYCTIL